MGLLVAIVASVTGTGGLFALFLKLRPEREKLGAERDLIITQAADQAVETITEMLDLLRHDLERSNREVARLMQREDELLQRIRRIEEKAEAEERSLRAALADCQQALEESRREYMLLLAEHTSLHAERKHAPPSR